MSEVVKIDDIELPEGWQMAELAELAINPKDDIVDGPFGSNLKASEYTETGVPIVRLQNIKRNYFLDKNIKCVTPEKAEQLSRHSFKPGDLLITKLGAPLGVACIAPHSIGEGIIVADLVRARLPEDQVDTKYITYLINSPVVIQEFKENTKGTTRPRVNLKFMRSLRLPIAPYEQQKRIVAKIEELFSHIDAGIEALKKAKQLLTQYRQSVLKAAVTGELTKEWREANKDKLEPASQLLERILKERRQKWEEQQLEQFKAKGKMPKDDKWKEKYKEPYGEYEETCELPKGWCWSTIDQLGEVQLGRQRSPKNRSEDYPTKYIRAANITEDGLDFTDLMDMEFKPNEFERYVMKENDLVLSEASGSPDQVGKPAIWRENMPVCCFQNTVIRHRPYGVEPEYLLVHYKYFYWCQIFSKTAGGVGINHLSAQKFLKMSIALPPLLEQKKIVNKVDKNIDALARLDAEIQLQLVKAEKNKQSILSTAFCGTLAREMI